MNNIDWLNTKDAIDLVSLFQKQLAELDLEIDKNLLNKINHELNYRRIKLTKLKIGDAILGNHNSRLRDLLLIWDILGFQIKIQKKDENDK